MSPSDIFVCVSGILQSSIVQYNSYSNFYLFNGLFCNILVAGALKLDLSEDFNQTLKQFSIFDDCRWWLVIVHLYI